MQEPCPRDVRCQSALELLGVATQEFFHTWVASRQPHTSIGARSPRVSIPNSGHIVTTPDGAPLAATRRARHAR